MSLKVGDMAPDFTLLTDEWKTVKLSDYRGKKNVFLAVYVLAFSEGCTKQMRAVQAGIDSGQIPAADTAVFGVSLDSPAANAGVSPLDVILEVNRQKVANVSQVTRELQKVQPGQPVFLLVWRDGTNVFVTMTKR